MELQTTKVTLPVLMTTDEAARYLGVSVAWFERDRWSGPTVPFVRFGRSVRYRAEDLRAYVETSTVQPVQ